MSWLLPVCGLPGKCERIIKTPVPFSFVLHLRTIILVYVRAWLASRTVDTHEGSRDSGF